MISHDYDLILKVIALGGCAGAALFGLYLLARSFYK